MDTDDRTWMVMLRDISRTVRVRDEPVVMAGLVLDMGTGLALASTVAASGTQALAQALEKALADPLPPSSSAPPDVVICEPELVSEVERQLARAAADAPPPPVVAVDPVFEAEDIFDSLVGHLAGRRQPDELAAPEDWQVLLHHVFGYWQEEPWRRWSDATHLALTVTVGGEEAPYLSVVLGAAGIQHGLVLYPGTTLPDQLWSWEPGRPAPIAPGTLMLFLDPSSDPAPELDAKAARYGWPPAAEVTPVWVGQGADGPVDLGRGDVQRLTLGLAAVVAHDARGPLSVGDGNDRTTGELALAGGTLGRFAIGQYPVPGFRS
ncbi:MAG: hypothetical protein ACRDYD_12425 [Acidimicrobiales bacterium]